MKAKDWKVVEFLLNKAANLDEAKGMVKALSNVDRILDEAVEEIKSKKARK